MSRTTKIVLALTGGFLALCLCSAVAGSVLMGAAGGLMTRSIVSGSREVSDAGTDIADYTLPAGYSPQYATHMLGFSLISIDPGTPRSHLYLMQFPAGLPLDQGQMENQMRKANRDGGRGEEWVNLRRVGEREMTLRGQAVTLTISEGTNSQDEPYRQMAGVFQRKAGPALVVASAPIAEWEAVNFDAFLASLR